MLYCLAREHVFATEPPLGSSFVFNYTITNTTNAPQLWKLYYIFPL